MKTTPGTTPGVVFDFGGVLVDWDPFPAVAHGMGEAEARRFFAEFDFHGWNLGPDEGQSWDDAMAALAASHPEFAEHGAAYRTHFRHALVGEIPGTAQILRELHAAGTPLVGLTNWSDELYHAHAPDRYDFVALFDDVIVSGTEKLAKPDPGIYRLVEERTGAPLSAWVFVDDRADNVAAARELGMDGILFTGAEELRRELRERGFGV